MKLLRRMFPRLVLLLASTLVLAILLDRLVALFVPALPPPRISHPPTHREMRHSVEFDYEFQTNSRGLRYRELPLERERPSELRVLVGGDSFAEGFGVGDEDRFSNRLERALSSESRPVSFINCGLSGTGPDEYGRTLFLAGAAYQPDLILLVLFPNDLTDTGEDVSLRVQSTEGGEFALSPARTWTPANPIRRFARAVLPWTYTRLQLASANIDARSLRGRPFREQLEERARRNGVSAREIEDWKKRTPPAALEAAMDDRFNGSQLARGLFEPDWLLRCLDVEGEIAEAQWTTMQRSLTEIVRLWRAQSVPCVAVYAPADVQYDPSGGDLERSTGVTVREEWLTGESELEQRLAGWARRSELPFLSLTDAFREETRSRPGALNFRWDEHWTAEGHALAARVIQDWLVDNRLVPSGAGG